MVYRLIWIHAWLILIRVNLSNQNSGLKKDFPFGFLNQTNQMLFEGNISEAFYNDQSINNIQTINNDQSIRSSWSIPDFFKGLMVTRVMPLIYIFIILISLPLNSLAMATFTCRVREKKPAVIYMAHLACVDLLFTLLLPLMIHYRLNASNWVFGEAACRLLSASYYGNMYCSVLLMMCMSVDRLLAVAFPIASLTWRTARRATCVCVVVWLLTLAGIVPLLMMKQTTKVRGGISCFDIWADSSMMLYFLVFLVLLCICFVLPLIVILVSYSIIIYVLCAKRDHSSSSSDNRRRAAIMATAVLTEFVVCFAPSNGLLLRHCVSLLKGGNGWDTYPPYLLAVCLGSSSVFLDPLLYYYGSSHYRQQIRSVFGSARQKS
ncbi:proteinase-activated receptor 1-like [Onychostoma macrolepis]|uniref:proteinase-activated receptor 1-like n=1 Tax=Onychostoma macrolepis TaxID=369639 RepID=UPI00272B60C4|nr:proteinase-activated receptor 1-like [Onychostoma macrolepis]